MCMQWMSCLCWRETKSPSVAILVFALVTSLLQIVVAIATFSSIAVNMQDVTQPLYIALAVADFCVVFFSLLLLCGLERMDDCHRWTVILWVGWVFIYILYESAINIFFFYTAFNNPRYGSIPKGFVVVFIIYWVCKEIILFTGWSFIVSHLCYGDALAAHYSDQTIQVANKNICGPATYSGGVAQVQIRDNPRPAVSSFDVIRPTSGCQVSCNNYGRGGGCPYQGGQDYYVPNRYM